MLRKVSVEPVVTAGAGRLNGTCVYRAKGDKGIRLHRKDMCNQVYLAVLSSARAHGTEVMPLELALAAGGHYLAVRTQAYKAALHKKSINYPLVSMTMTHSSSDVPTKCLPCPRSTSRKNTLWPVSNDEQSTSIESGILMAKLRIFTFFFVTSA